MRVISERPMVCDKGMSAGRAREERVKCADVRDESLRLSVEETLGCGV